MRWRRCYGFALLEALISLIIFGVAALGVTLLQAKLIKATVYAAQYYEASSLAQQKMESFRNYANLITYAAIGNGNQTYTGRNATYNTAWTVSSNTYPPYKTISIAVTWTNSDAIGESLAISSTIPGTDPAETGNAISNFTPILP